MPTSRKDLLRGEQSIQRRREAGIDRHLDQDFDNLVAAEPDIQSGRDMHLQLRGGMAEPDPVQFGAAFPAGVEAIKSRGKADLGEKTMLDVLIPVSRLLQRPAEQGAPLPALCGQLTAEAHRNMLATRDMTATKGRASFLGERAIGHIDPGSKTCEVAIAAVCETLKEPA